MWAAAERHADVVKLLLQHGADWKVQSSFRETKIPKLSAASSVSPISRGGLTAFLFAAREGDIETAKAMLDHGVDINQTDVDGTSGLVVSIMNKQYTFAKFLLDRGADPNVTDVKGRAALYAAIDMRNEDWSALPMRKEQDPLPSMDLIKAILAHGANPNAALTHNLPGRSGMDYGDVALDEGTTPFMRAARSGDAATMRVLLAAGADPKLVTKDGNNALLFAAGIGYRDKNTRGTDAEALEALQLCMDQGLDISQTNGKGETALHGAANRGSDLLVKFLVEHGAKLDAKSKAGFTPLDIAWVRTASACRFLTTAPWRCCEAWAAQKERGDKIDPSWDADSPERLPLLEFLRLPGWYSRRKTSSPGTTIASRATSQPYTFKATFI